MPNKTLWTLTTALLAIVLPACGAAQDCAAGSRTGPKNSVDERKTAGGVGYNVHTGHGYGKSEGTEAFPLIVMYAGLGDDQDDDEKKVDLGELAWKRGYILVYTGHFAVYDQPGEEKKMTASVADAASVVTDVAADWCVDLERVFLLGNSDGATIASEIVLGEHLAPAPRALVVNAVGTSESYLEEKYSNRCPPSIPFMSMHGSLDEVFPIKDGYGRDVTDFWADCNGCEPYTTDPVTNFPQEDNCVHYVCPFGAPVIYCQSYVDHGDWGMYLNDNVMEFVDRFGRVVPSP